MEGKGFSEFSFVVEWVCVDAYVLPSSDAGVFGSHPVDDEMMAGSIEFVYINNNAVSFKVRVDFQWLRGTFTVTAVVHPLRSEHT